MYFGFCYPTLQYSFVFCSPSIYEHYSTLNSNGIKLYGFCILARTSSIWFSVLGYFPYITSSMDKYRFYSWLSYYFLPKYYWSLYMWFYATSGIGLPWNFLGPLTAAYSGSLCLLTFCILIASSVVNLHSLFIFWGITVLKGITKPSLPAFIMSLLLSYSLYFAHICLQDQWPPFPLTKLRVCFPY